MGFWFVEGYSANLNFFNTWSSNSKSHFIPDNRDKLWQNTSQLYVNEIQYS